MVPIKMKARWRPIPAFAFEIDGRALRCSFFSMRETHVSDFSSRRDQGAPSQLVLTGKCQAFGGTTKDIYIDQLRRLFHLVYRSNADLPIGVTMENLPSSI